MLIDLSAQTALSGADNCFLKSTATTYTLPAILGLPDGALVALKNTAGTGSVVINPNGSDSINGGGGTQSITLTSAGAGAGQGALIVASKQSGLTWWVIVKPQ